MSDRVHRKCDAVLNTDLAHKFCDMRFHGTLFDAQSGSDFLVGAAGDQQLEDFFLAIRKGDAASGKDASGRRGNASR